MSSKILCEMDPWCGLGKVKEMYVRQVEWISMLRGLCLDKIPSQNLNFIDTLRPRDAYMHQYTKPLSVQKVACWLLGVKPLSGPNVGLSLIGPLSRNFCEIGIKI